MIGKEERALNTVKINLGDSKEVLNSLSKLETTFFSISPLIDNQSLIKHKLDRQGTKIYSLEDPVGVKAVFLVKIYPHNKELAYIDALFLDEGLNNKEKENMISDFIGTIKSIYNIKYFIKHEEMQDERAILFETIGFSVLCKSIKSIYNNGKYNDQKMYYLSTEEVI